MDNQFNINDFIFFFGKLSIFTVSVIKVLTGIRWCIKKYFFKVLVPIWCKVEDKP